MDKSVNSGVVRRKKNEIYVPNPVLGHVLTALFFVLIAFVLWALYDEGQASNEAISPIATFGVCLVACSLLIWLCKLSSTFVAQLLNRLLVWAGFVDKAPISGRAQIKKWQDQSWQLVIHVSMAAFEVYLLNFDCPGLWSDSSLAWVPSPFGDYKPSTILKRFYLFQLAIWTVTCFIHRFSAERIKDYYMMYLHHILTIALIVGSYYLSYLRIGLLVLLVHDASDIGVDMLKLSNYTKMRDRRGWYIVEIVFALNLMSWIFWRLFIFPFHVIYASLVSSMVVLLKPDMPASQHAISALMDLFSPRVMHYPGLPYWGIANVLLIALQFLHVIWTFLFFRLLYRIVVQDTQTAGQMEYEGDSEDDDDVDDSVTKKQQ